MFAKCFYITWKLFFRKAQWILQNVEVKGDREACNSQEHREAPQHEFHSPKLWLNSDINKLLLKIQAPGLWDSQNFLCDSFMNHGPLTWETLTQMSHLAELAILFIYSQCCLWTLHLWHLSHCIYLAESLFLLRKSTLILGEASIQTVGVQWTLVRINQILYKNSLKMPSAESAIFYPYIMEVVLYVHQAIAQYIATSPITTRADYLRTLTPFVGRSLKAGPTDDITHKRVIMQKRKRWTL